jgi:UDP-2,3-diacylglucosamine pyrophosphatase LpxH
MNAEKREIDLVVLSDVHLGTYGCQAAELLKYLKSIKPGTLILNGDILDIWQFKKSYWPRAHMKVIKQIIGMAADGTKTYYITGNHDEILRKFSGLNLGLFHMVNDLKLKLEGGDAWFFHGDVFDVIIQNSKWLAKLGAVGYDLLIMVNTFINYFSQLMGKPKVSMSKKIKDNVKSAVKYINNFEETAARIGFSKGFKYVVCGHIHKVQHRRISFGDEELIYLNSGDWVESLTALEYNKGKWAIYEYKKDPTMDIDIDMDFDKELAVVDLEPNVILAKMFHEFQP